MAFADIILVNSGSSFDINLSTSTASLISGTINGTCTPANSGTLKGKGRLIGASNGTCTPPNSGIIKGKAPISGTTNGTCTPANSGVLIGKLYASGTINGTCTPANSGILKGKGILSGISTGVCTPANSGILKGKGILSGISAGVCTPANSGILKGKGKLNGETGNILTDDFQAYSVGVLGGQGNWVNNCPSTGIAIKDTAGDKRFCSNEAHETCAKRIETIGSDQFAQFTVDDNGGASGVAVRCSYTSSVYYYFAYYANAGQKAVLYSINGSFNTIDFTGSSGWSNGDIVRLEIIGNSLRCYRNGTIDTLLPGGGVYDVSSIISSYPALGSGGVGVSSCDSADTIGRGDDFRGGIVQIISILKGKGLLSGISNGVSNVSGDCKEKPSGAISGTINGVATVTGLAFINLLGASNGVATVSGLLKGKGILSGTSGSGPSLMDSGKGTFDSGTESWVAYGTNIISNDAGALKIEYVDNQYGAYTYLRETYDLSQDLIVGKSYVIDARVKVGSGNTIVWQFYNGATGQYAELFFQESSWTWIHLKMIAQSTTECFFRLRTLGTGEIAWIDEWLIYEQAGTVTSGSITGKGKLAGVSNGVASVSGTIKGWAPILGVSNGVASVSGLLKGKGILKGGTGNNLIDSGKGVFDTDVESWIPYTGSNNLVENDGNGALRVTYIDSSNGGMTYLRSAGDLSSDLTIGKTYKIWARCKVNNGSSVILRVNNPVTNIGTVNTINYLWYKGSFVAASVSSSFFYTISMSDGEIIYIDQWYILEVLGSTLSGNLKGKGSLSGVINGVSDVSGELLPNSLRATSNGVSTVSGTIKGKGRLSGTINGVASLSGSIKGFIDIAGSTSGQSSVSGNLKGKGKLIGVINGVASVSGSGLTKRYANGTINGSSQLTGALAGWGYLYSAIYSGTTVSGLIKAKGKLSGIINGIATLTGDLIISQILILRTEEHITIIEDILDITIPDDIIIKVDEDMVISLEDHIDSEVIGTKQRKSLISGSSNSVTTVTGNL